MSRPALRLTPRVLGSLARTWSAAETFAGSCSARAASARGLSVCSAGRSKAAVAAGATVLATEAVAVLRVLLEASGMGTGTAIMGVAGDILIMLVVLVALVGGIEVARVGIMAVYRV